mmetsp:Transcript_3215/g.5715  ORF Transcript_3215/g.5715 Transcript_3215/m.5715 type:complete len:96 (+) Transcript_3215:387-674(+)
MRYNLSSFPFLVDPPPRKQSALCIWGTQLDFPYNLQGLGYTGKDLKTTHTHIHTHTHKLSHKLSHSETHTLTHTHTHTHTYTSPSPNPSNDPVFG